MVTRKRFVTPLDATRKVMVKSGLLIALLSVVCMGTTAEAYVIVSFGPDVYDGGTPAMDAALGITGYTIEDFEDSTLVDGLTISGFGFIEYPSNEPQDAWDGTKTATFWGVTEAAPGALNFVGGASSVGIGLSSLHNETNLFRVNGGDWITLDLTNFPDWAIYNNPDPNQAGYLRIDQEFGDAPITSIELADPQDETLRMDHVAFIPEPSTLTMLACAFVALGLLIRRRWTL